MCYRSGQLIFVLSNWMADPKCTDEIRNRWLDIWGQVCAQVLSWQMHVSFAVISRSFVLACTLYSCEHGMQGNTCKEAP